MKQYFHWAIHSFIACMTQHTVVRKHGPKYKDMLYAVHL